MVIELSHITFGYTSDDIIFDDLSLKVNTGEMIALIGHNGCGKSTLAKLLMGLLLPTKGDIFIDGVKLTEDNIDDYRVHMGIIFQNPDNQFVGVTVADDIAFGMENANINRVEMLSRISKCLKLVDMEGFELSNPEELSGGQKQRVAIAGVLAMDPEVIIFDEATSMLDPKGTKEVNKMIYDIKKNTHKSIISITHNLEEALFADRVIVLNNGKIVLDGTPFDVLQNRSVLESSGLALLDGLYVLDELKKKEFIGKKEIMEALWKLIFNM